MGPNIDRGGAACSRSAKMRLREKSRSSSRNTDAMASRYTMTATSDDAAEWNESVLPSACPMGNGRLSATQPKPNTASGGSELRWATSESMAHSSMTTSVWATPMTTSAQPERSRPKSGSASTPVAVKARIMRHSRLKGRLRRRTNTNHSTTPATRT